MNKTILVIVGLIVVIGLLFMAVIINNNNSNPIENIMNNEQNKSDDTTANETSVGSDTDNDTNIDSGSIIDKEVKITLKTNLGDIGLELYPSKAPKTVENFVSLAKDDFYDGTRFHRVIDNFMIQGGDPNSKDESKKSIWGTGGPGYTFEDEENDIALERGVIAMANSGPDTNGSQFFIITADQTPWLQGMHTAYGKVISGMEVVEEIENVETNSGDQPQKDIIVEDVEVTLE